MGAGNARSSMWRRCGWPWGACIASNCAENVIGRCFDLPNVFYRWLPKPQTVGVREDGSVRAARTQNLPGPSTFDRRQFNRLMAKYGLKGGSGGTAYMTSLPHSPHQATVCWQVFEHLLLRNKR